MADIPSFYLCPCTNTYHTLKFCSNCIHYIDTYEPTIVMSEQLYHGKEKI